MMSDGELLDQVGLRGGEYRPQAEVWVLPREKVVLLTDFPGPPASICGFVSEEAKAAAEVRGCATVSEIGFPSECYLGSFALPEEGGWGEAKRVAKAKAIELGYRVVYESSLFCDDDYYEDPDMYLDEPFWEEDWDWEDEE